MVLETQRQNGPETTPSDVSWKGYLDWKSAHSHSLMIWCAVFIYPAFSLLDFLVVEQWQVFVQVRMSGIIALLVLLYLRARFTLCSTLMAHIASQIIIVSLMWMLSQVQTREQFWIYSLNISTGYIASAIFFLWHPRNSVFFAVSTLLVFILFWVTMSPLTFTDIIVSGMLPLLTIIIMSQFFVYHRYSSVRRDYSIQWELNRVNQILHQKNTEIHQQHLEIKKQKDNLENLNELKDRLFMIISHDFKGPLNSLKGLMMLINDSDKITPEEFKGLVKSLKHTVDKTYDFLEGLLFWSRSQMRGFRLKKVNVNMFSIVHENIHLLESQANLKNITIQNNIKDNAFVCADADMIRLVLRNLIANAIKFTPHGGRITIASEEVAEEWLFHVHDTGIGMDAEDVARFFESGSPSQKIGTQAEKGTGLGLLLCKEFILRNDGRLSVESKAGEGSTFTIALPAVHHQSKALDFF